jgi:hypothetical protein
VAFSHLESLNVHHLTSHQPFCAGVVLIYRDCLVVTLNTDGLPSGPPGDDRWRVGGVGGGQEPEETIWECALREAREELCNEVELVTSRCTYFHDIDSGDLYEVACSDNTAPLLLERQSNFYPYTPYRPGLPTGPYTYFGIFLARLKGDIIQPGDDVEGLLLIPLALWSVLLQQPALGTMLQHGANVIERESLPRTRKLWVSPDESFRVVVPLLMQHPELLLF